jgi:hypothetical protein
MGTAPENCVLDDYSAAGIAAPPPLQRDRAGSLYIMDRGYPDF